MVDVDFEMHAQSQQFLAGTKSRDRNLIARVEGHFGEWLQGRLGSDGPITLLTVPCPELFVEAEKLSDGPLKLTQSPEVLDLAQVRKFLAKVGGQSGTYRLTATMPPGGGAGASTAALVALARASGAKSEQVAKACIAAEGASDPLMLHRPDRVLWASREGRALQDVPPLPSAEIVGGFWGPALATDPADRDFADVSDLVRELASPLSLRALADIASSSAQRCNSIRGPSGDPTEKLANDLGALGHLRAHSGSARGLIFAPGTAPSQAERALRAAGFQRILRFSSRRSTQ